MSCSGILSTCLRWCAGQSWATRHTTTTKWWTQICCSCLQSLATSWTSHRAPTGTLASPSHCMPSLCETFKSMLPGDHNKYSTADTAQGRCSNNTALQAGSDHDGCQPMHAVDASTWCTFHALLPNGSPMNACHR